MTGFAPIGNRTTPPLTAGGERGTSLVELLLGATIVMLILFTVLTLTIRQSNQRRSNFEQNLATLAAIETLEQIRSVPFAELPDLDGAGFEVRDANGAPGGLTPLPGDEDGMPGTLVVIPELSYGGRDLYRVRAIVEWTGVQRRSRLAFQQLVVERR